MKVTFLTLTLWFSTAAFFVGTSGAQKKDVSKLNTSGGVIFAITDAGKTIEPIGVVNGGRFKAESEEPEDMSVFARQYYKPKTTYSVIFGGAKAGTATIVKSNIGTECGGSTADVSVTSDTAKLSRMVMALASDLKFVSNAKGYRRPPTQAERTTIETLVRDSFRKHGATPARVRNLRYHNLTAVDVEGDGVAEFVGTYWIAASPKERRLLFFIAELNRTGKLMMSHSEHSVVKSDDLMSGDLSHFESGMISELLIDLLDYDNDGIKEIFTVVQAFEGNNYNVYKRDAGKWIKARETSVYRCAY